MSISSVGQSQNDDLYKARWSVAALLCTFAVAICLANLIVWASGSWAPWVSLVCGFVLVGLDMVIKDTLQNRWGVSWRLMLLVVGGGVAGFLAPGSARICAASVAAFMVSALVDVAVFAALARSPRRYVASNAASALVDSSLFLWFGLGVFGWPVLAQTVAKIAGAALWQRVLHQHDVARAGVDDVACASSPNDSPMSA
ncbi:hypothetical protein [Haliangium sp. UPWRP_2]|uniref:hypothetical protein n=1 Tax=Haliangium sp. UPWRP_2 TaxID=1931276 RepID=UPI001E2EE5E3|nr:hypothetical protein [Haliangium sp. UPWRP_2]